MTASPADRRIRRYVRRTVYPYSAHYHAVLDGAGVGARVRGRADLTRIPPTDLARVTDPGSLVLRPDLGRILRHGRPGLAVWGAAARVTGGMHRFSRHVERRFKPILWVLADDVPLGYSAADVSLLARRGAAWLQRAGVTKGDVVVSLLAPGPSVAYWQLTLGLRRAGVSAIHLDPATEPAAFERLAPSVLVGEPAHLATVLAAARADGRAPRSVRTVLAVGGPLGSDLRARLADLAGGAAVVGAWAPEGVRAVWSECRAGAAQAIPTGYHAWDDDLLEIAGRGDGGAAEGEVLWSGLAWGGSALLRLRTFAVAGLLSHACPACGRPGMLVVPHAPVPRELAPDRALEPMPGPVAAALVPPAPPAPGVMPAPSGPPAPPAPWAPPGAATPPAPGVMPAPPAPPAPWGGPPASAPPSWPAPPSAPPPAAPAPATVPVAVAAALVGAADGVRVPTPVGEVFDSEPEVASWVVEYRTVDGRAETIVTFAPAWGAAVVPLIRRLDRHFRATQFVVVSVDEVSAKIAAAGGGRVIGAKPA